MDAQLEEKERQEDAMQVQTMQGYFDKGAFFQHGRRVRLPERRMAIVNVLSIPVGSVEVHQEEIAFWREMKMLVEAAADEVLSLDDFPRAYFGRELISFGGEPSS